MEEVPELLVLTIRECFVYMVPPLRSASGHRAEDWKLENPLFTGCLKVFQADVKLRIVLYSFIEVNGTKSNTDENLLVFCECRIEIKAGDNILSFVDAVIDSSRYFALRVKDPNSNRSTSVGIGFREREAAFDFKNCLNEYVRYVERMALAAKLAFESSAQSQEMQNTDRGDRSLGESNSQGVGVPASSSIISSLLQHIKPLQDGEKMQLKIKGLSHQHQSQNTCSKEKEKEKEGKSVFKIKPPPPPIPAAANEDQGWDDEEFGSWESGSGASLSSSSIVDSTVSAPEAT